MSQTSENTALAPSIDLTARVSDDLLGRILSYLTLFEWFGSQSVCHRWRNSVLPCAIQKHVHHIYLSQFWALLGNPDFDAEPLGKALGQAEHVEKITLSYSRLLNDAAVVRLLRYLHPSCKETLVSIDLYFCCQITNASVLNVLRMFPNIKHLNIGSCFFLTDACISSIMKFGQNIEELDLSYNKKMTSEILIELGTHESLKILNLENTCVQKEAVIEQCIATPHIVILGPVPVAYAKAYQPARKQEM